MRAVYSLLVALVVLVCVQERVTLAQQPTKDFMFLFVQGWPGTICKDLANCNNLPSSTHPGPGFMIHGLWAQYYDHGWPQNCDNSNVFSESQVSDLLGNMNYNWPSLMGAMNGDDFWTHEWQRHGTCATSVFPTQHDFFSNVLALRQKYDVAAILAASNITPGSAYNTQDIVSAVSSTTGYDPSLTCKNGDLWEMWICFDKGLNPTACPVSTVIPDPCGSSANIPADPFPYSNYRPHRAADAAPLDGASMWLAGAALFVVGALIGAAIVIVVVRRRTSVATSTQEPLLATV